MERTLERILAAPVEPPPPFWVQGEPVLDWSAPGHASLTMVEAPIRASTSARAGQRLPTRFVNSCSIADQMRNIRLLSSAGVLTEEGEGLLCWLSSGRPSCNLR